MADTTYAPDEAHTTYECTLCGKTSDEPLGPEHDDECSKQAATDRAQTMYLQAVRILRQLTATHSPADPDATEAREFLKELDG